MTRRKRAILAIAAGIAITAAAALPIPYAEYTLWPGEALAALFWPEGIHSDISEGFGVLAMLAVVWGVALTGWTVVAYLAACIFGESRAA